MNCSIFYLFKLEMQLENIGVRSQKELILLHHEDATAGFRISHTVDWLNARGWICAHHHVSAASLERWDMLFHVVWAKIT